MPPRLLFEVELSLMSAVNGSANRPVYKGPLAHPGSMVLEGLRVTVVNADPLDPKVPWVDKGLPGLMVLEGSMAYGDHRGCPVHKALEALKGYGVRLVKAVPMPILGMSCPSSLMRLRQMLPNCPTSDAM